MKRVPRLATVLLFLTTTASAQSWVGSGGLVVEVRDGGRAVAQASVRLEYLGRSGAGGPAPGETDASGRATFVELADGPWLVSVRHSETMGYDARVELVAGKRPRESAAAQVKVGAATRRLKVRFLGGPHSATPRSRSPGPGASTTPSASARPVTRDEKPRSLPAFLRTSRDGSCPECRPGEWAVSALGEARTPGGPGCPERLRAVAERLAEALTQDAGDEAASPEWTGPLDHESAPEALALAIPVELESGACQILALKLPSGATMGGFQIDVLAGAGALPCPPDSDCPGGAGRLDRLPVTAETDSGRVVLAAFRHEGARRDVRPRLTVYFVPAGSWEPPFQP